MIEYVEKTGVTIVINKKDDDFMKVYHGSKSLFDTFEYKYIGTNGTIEGKGFYFTDSLDVATRFAEEGYLYTVEFNEKKSLSSKEVTFSKGDLKKYLLALHEKTNYLSNWGDVQFEGLENVLQEALDSTYDDSNNDVELISGIVNSSGDIETSLSLLYNLFAFDSIVVDADWGDGQRLYIALTNEIIKIVDVKEIKKI